MLRQLRSALRVSSRCTASPASMAWRSTSTTTTEAEVVAETTFVESKAPQTPPAHSRRLLFKNLSPNADYMKLAAKMQEAGDLSNFFIQLANGTGLVEYVAADDAKRAVELLDQKEFDGNVLSVCETQLTKEELQAQLQVEQEEEQPEDPQAFKRTLAVDNLPDIGCYAAFRNHVENSTGSSEAIWMHTSSKDLKTHDSSIRAFVRYASEEDAAKALETLKGLQFMNQELGIRAATEQEFKQEQ